MSIEKKYTRLDLIKRIQIQSKLNEDASLSAIARLIGVSVSTVSREVKTHRLEDNHVTRFHSNSCVHRKECKKRNVCPAMDKICKKMIDAFSQKAICLRSLASVLSTACIFFFVENPDIKKLETLESNLW